MAKKSIGQKKAERQQQEDRVLRRVFNVFLLGILAECYLFIVYRNYVLGDALLEWYYVLKYGCYVGFAMLLAGAALAIFKRKDDRLRRIMTWVAGIGLFLGVSGWVMSRIYPQGVTAMCVIVPVVTLLGLVFFLFQHECFLNTVVLAGTLFTVWVCSSGLDSVNWRVPVIVGAVLVLVVLAGLAALTRRAQQGGGKLGAVRVCSVECDYRVIYGVLAVSFLSVLVSLVFVPAAYYLLWVLGILLFAELVFYTTKLM